MRLSASGKMPCKSWSLEALDTCPGSRTRAGDLVDACKGCYATDGNYRFKNVKAVRAHNLEAWKADSFITDMVDAIHGDDYFRWFDSGDMYSLTLATKIYAIMRATPNTQHWLPTRMHKFAKFRGIIRKMQALPNVVVRFSSDSIHGDYDKRWKNASTIIEHDTGEPNTCDAYSRGGKCGDCRACWDKSIDVIRYPQHGRKMAKVNRDIIASAA